MERAGVVLAVAAGGAIGSVARYGLSVALPHAPGQFPLATLLINVSGCLLIGMLMATISASANPHRLLRPFLGVGVLGGFTTLSTYAVEVLETDAVWLAVLYSVSTVLLALTATTVGLVVTRALINRGQFGGKTP